MFYLRTKLSFLMKSSIFVGFFITFSWSSASARTVLVYYCQCDAWGTSVGQNIIAGLKTDPQNNVTQIDISNGGTNCSTPYCPGANASTAGPKGEIWKNFDQVWDIRYVNTPVACPPGAPNSDFFASCWQTTAQDYVSNYCGNLFMLSENSGFSSRWYGNEQLLQTLGAVAAGFVLCPTGSNANDYGSDAGDLTVNNLPGSTQAYFADEGGIPDSLLNGTSFVDVPASSYGSSQQRSAAAGWSGAAQLKNLSGCKVGKVSTYYDMDGWDTGNYTGPETNVQNAYVTALADWFGSASCPCNFTLTKTAEGVTTSPDGMILYDLDYQYLSSAVTITDSVPPNTTFMAMGPGGTNTGGALTWTLPNSATTATGSVWFLVRANSGLTNGMAITNTASGQSSSATITSNAVTTTIAVPNLTLTKSQVPSSSVANGQPVTYALAWSADGQNLQYYDSYDNDGPASVNGSIVGYDGTGYTYTNTGGIGGFSTQTDASGNNYIMGCAYSSCLSSNTNGNFPTLLRKGPTVGLCQNFTVEGDLQIPSSAAPGGDATMVLADNLAVGGVDDAYMLGISLDCGPGNFFIQKNNQSGGGAVGWPATPCDNQIGTTITAGVWYTAKAMVTYSAGSLTIQARVWPRGTAEPVTWSINYTDNSPLPCIPGAGGSYQIGWQADGTSSTDYFANLKLFGPGPVVNAAVTDVIPSGISYSGSTTTTSSSSPLIWNAPTAFPATMLAQTGPISWWGTASCPGPIYNNFTMGGDSLNPATSNSVTLTISGSCITNTPTNTPTVTLSPTPTISLTPTNTPTPTITLTPTNTPTPVDTPTFTPTPVGLHVWPIPFDPKYAVGGVLKAYQVPAGATMSIYTVSGESVVNPPLLPDTTGTIYWDGRNSNGSPVSAGIYYYVIKNGNSTLLSGKILLVRN